MTPKLAPSPLRIVFMGTPSFAVPSLQALVQGGYRPVAVVTAPDRPRGRGQGVQAPAVKEAATELGLQVLQPERLDAPEFISQMASLEPDVIVVVAFRILPPELYSLARLGAFNLHASLLPRFRGAAPINRAIMAGEIETGVTTFYLEPTVDTGAIILKHRTAIGPDETAGELHDRLAEIGARAVVETLEHIEAGTAEARPQEDERASPAPKIFREDARIPWGKPAADVHNHVRGLSPYPAAWTNHDQTLLKILRTEVDRGSGEPGEVLQADEEGLVVACGEEAVRILEIQREGRDRMSSIDFTRGYDMRPGDRLQ